MPQIVKKTANLSAPTEDPAVTLSKQRIATRKIELVVVTGLKRNPRNGRAFAEI